MRSIKEFGLHNRKVLNLQNIAGFACPIRLLLSGLLTVKAWPILPINVSMTGRRCKKQQGRLSTATNWESGKQSGSKNCGQIASRNPTATGYKESRENPVTKSFPNQTCLKKNLA